jgi:hypothetical protein
VPPGENVQAFCGIDTAGRRTSVKSSFNLLYKNVGETELVATAACSISASIENIVLVSPGFLAFNGSKDGVAGIDLTFPAGIEITGVSGDDDAVGAVLDGSRRITVTFSSKQWTPGHQGNMNLIIRTSCPTEAQILVPVHVN